MYNINMQLLDENLKSYWRKAASGFAFQPQVYHRKHLDDDFLPAFTPNSTLLPKT
jgi:hypothetical protein